MASARTKLEEVRNRQAIGQARRLLKLYEADMVKLGIPIPKPLE